MYSILYFHTENSIKYWFNVEIKLFLVELWALSLWFYNFLQTWDLPWFSYLSYLRQRGALSTLSPPEWISDTKICSQQNIASSTKIFVVLNMVLMRSFLHFVSSKLRLFFFFFSWGRGFDQKRMWERGRDPMSVIWTIQDIKRIEGNSPSPPTLPISSKINSYLAVYFLHYNLSNIFSLNM